MKKLIAILVVFAVFAGAAFAQDGSWSISSSGNIGTRINFIPMLNEGGHATALAQSDNRGNFGIDYKKGILTAGLSFNQRAELSGSLKLAGDNWNFTAIADLLPISGANGGVKLNGTSGDVHEELWGNFTFVDILEGLFLEAAVNKDSQQWVAETILGDSFSKGVGRDYVLLDLTAYKSTGDDASVLTVGYKLPGLFSGVSNSNASADFLDDLNKSVIGAKFTTKLGTDSALDVAFQFHLNGYGEEFKRNIGLRFMAKFTIDKSMWAAVDFKGVFGYKNGTDANGNVVDSANLQFGAKFNFVSTDEDKVFNFDVALKFLVPDTALNAAFPKVAESRFDAILNVGYKIEPKYFQAKIGLEFGFPIRGADLPTNVAAAALKYVITPEVNFNFLGTGAGTTDTGIILAYKIAGDMGYAQTGNENNALTLTFKWKF